MKLPFWIQRADFSATTHPPVDAEGAVRAYESQDWLALLKELDQAKAAGKDCCEPNLGFSDKHRTLRLSPAADGERVFIEYILTKKLLGFLPIPLISYFKTKQFPKCGVAEAIRLFFACEHELLVAAITMLMPPLPESARDVLAFIQKADQEEKRVWSVQDYIRQADLGIRLDALPPSERRAILRQLRIFFAELADEGLLRCREDEGAIAEMDDKASFEYVGARIGPKA